MDCPTADCGGELQFRVHAEYDGEGVWTSFRGYSAECVEKNCDCEYSYAQWEELERQAVQEAAEYDPADDLEF